MYLRTRQHLLACLQAIALLASCARLAAENDEAAMDAYETDRPGEIENPFTIPQGQAQSVDYVAHMNESAREDAFGGDGAAWVLDSALRFGITPQIEGAVAIDSFLADRSSRDADSGVGFATLTAKWNFLKDASGDFGLSASPFVRVPLEKEVAGTSRPAPGLAVPFHIDLEGGWEMEGSSSFTRAPGESGSWTDQWENQLSLERTLTRQLTAYAEAEVELGEDRPAWGVEMGITLKLSPRASLDLGGNAGIGRDSRGRTGYAGIGWRL